MSLTWRRSRITGAGLVAAQYDLTLERQTIMENILLIPGIANPVSEINQLLFGQGQQGTFIAPSLTASLISGSTFGTGVETLPDLSPRNNPFSQATPSSRAAWFREPKTGRRNLLLQTEALTTSPWQNTAGFSGFNGTGIQPVVTQTTGMDGSNTAWRLQLNCGGGTTSNDRSGIFQEWNFATGQYSSSVIVKPLDGITNAQLAAITTFGTPAAGGTPVVTVTDMTDGWKLLTSVVTTTLSTGTFRFQILGNTRQTLDIIVWRPNVNTGATPTPYQRVTTNFDVTESGQRDCFGVRADGIDDGYATAGNVDFSGTDKVTIFAAVRKLSDAAASSILAHGADFATVGAFELQGNTAANATTAFRGRSTSGSTAQAGFTRDVASPSTFILTATIDYSLAAGLEFAGRYNQVAQTQNTGETQENTGTLGNHALHLFRRGGTTLPFNGNLYALIVAGGSYPLSTIQRVERILSRITPTVNL